MACSLTSRIALMLFAGVPAICSEGAGFGKTPAQGSSVFESYFYGPNSASLSSLSRPFAWQLPRESNSGRLPVLPQSATKPHKGYIDDTLVEVVPPAQPASLGEPFKLFIKLKSSYPYTIFADQRSQSYSSGVMESIHGGAASLNVMRDVNGETYVTLTPLRLGLIEWRLFGSTKDGGVFSKKVQLVVHEPAKVPKALLTESLPVVMDLRHPHSEAFPLAAKYDDSETLYEIGPSFARYSIKTKGKGEVVRLDESTGTVVPVHDGIALLKISYGGLTTDVCLIVTSKESNVVEEQSNCSEIR